MKSPTIASTDYQDSALFDESQISWTSASPKYLQVRLLGGLIFWLVVCASCCFPLMGNVFWGWNWWNLLVFLLPGIALIWAVIDLSLTGRRVRALGYSEQEEHLLIRRGLMFHKVMAVPYGRMQYVEVKVGPLARLFGLAELELHTAADMSASIVGIPEKDAQRLRAVLTERGEEKMVALS